MNNKRKEVPSPTHPKQKEKRNEEMEVNEKRNGKETQETKDFGVCFFLGGGWWACCKCTRKFRVSFG